MSRQRPLKILAAGLEVIEVILRAMQTLSSVVITQSQISRMIYEYIHSLHKIKESILFTKFIFSDVKFVRISVLSPSS